METPGCQHSGHTGDKQWGHSGDPTERSHKDRTWWLGHRGTGRGTIRNLKQRPPWETRKGMDTPKDCEDRDIANTH